MKIEGELKQRFVNIHKRAQLNIMYSGNWLVDRAKEVLKPMGITHQQFNILKILKGKYPNSCASYNIKEVMLDKGPDITRLIDRLIEKQLVKRTVCKENRRKLDIILSDKGLVLVNKIEPYMRKKFLDQKRITNKEASELNRILDKMRG